MISYVPPAATVPRRVYAPRRSRLIEPVGFIAAMQAGQDQGPRGGNSGGRPGAFDAGRACSEAAVSRLRFDMEFDRALRDISDFEGGDDHELT